MGFILRHESPVEWGMILVMRKTLRKISLPIIEQITSRASNPLFLSQRYKEAVEDFRQYGLYTPNKRTLDTEDELRMIIQRINKREPDFNV